MKKLSYLIVIVLISSLVLAGCSLLSNISQVPTTEQSGISYLTKEILYPELVALWHFDEGSEATIVADSSGNDNAGDIYDATPGEVGQFSNALSFDGNDYVMVPGSTSLSGINSVITVETWIKFSSVTNAFYVRTPYDNEDSRAWGLDRLGGNLRFYIYENNNYFICQKWWTPEADKWYHIAGTYNGEILKLYVDKVLVKSFGHVGAIDSTKQGVVIGAKYSDGREGNLYGLIDEVRIWNGALSEEQLGKVYDFDGFFRPIDNDGTNAAKAGRAIPVKFSLNGDQGMKIFAEDYPRSINITCDSGISDGDEINTLTAGESSLNYDADADQYIYVWKTDESWAGACRRLEVKLKDGTSYSADFKFK